MTSAKPQSRRGRVKAPAPVNHESDHCHEPVSAGEIAHMGPAKGLDGVELLYGKYRRFSFARHFHSTTAIGVVETGVMRTCCHNAMYRAPAGSVILLNPGDVHAPHPGHDGGWSFRMLYLDDSLLREVGETAQQNRPLWFVQPFVENRKLYSELLALHRMLENVADPLAAECRLVAALEQIVSYSSWTARRDPSDVGKTKIERVRDYLHAGSAEAVNLKTLSLVADLSPWHLLRSFRARFGLTPHAYHTQARIERGRKLLASGVAIAEVALETGFVDQSHFTRHFKKFTGVTPGQYSGVCAAPHA